jgi:hypothetical protein
MTETDLRWQLRQLPREMEPTRDLWPGIEAAIGRQSPQRRSSWRHLTSLAMAASLVLAAGLFWKSQPGPGAGLAPPDPSARVVSTESRAITAEYQAALRQYDGAPISSPMRTSLGELDRSVTQIQRAIERDPHSVFLLQQLRKTYSRRLALTQRAIAT